MDIDKVLEALTPEIVERFKTAIELGKWPNGEVLTEEQKETCMQAVIAYEHRNIDEHMRTGYVPPKSTPCDTIEDESPITWKK